MTRSIHIIRASLIVVAVMALLWPAPVHSQQGSAFSVNTLGNPDAVVARFRSLMQGVNPVAPNPFQPPWSGTRKPTNDRASSDSLGFQLDRPMTTVLAQYA